MTTPKEALEAARKCIWSGGDTLTTIAIIDEALASLQGEDAVERVARIIEPYAKLDGVPRSWIENYRRETALAKARAILATGLVPDEAAVRAATLDFHAHLQRQREWSERTFGPGPRTKGVCDHIRKELTEIEAAPSDIEEWIDVVILALDGAWRAGATPDQIIAALVAKQTRNEKREWPDWRTADPNKAIEHVRTAAIRSGGGSNV